MTRSLPVLITIDNRPRFIRGPEYPAGILPVPGGLRATRERFLLPLLRVARVSRVIRYQSKRRVFPNSVGLQDARGPYFCAPHHALQKPRGRLAKCFQRFLRLLIHVSKHGASNVGKTRKCVGEIRNVMR